MPQRARKIDYLIQRPGCNWAVRLQMPGSRASEVSLRTADYREAEVRAQDYIKEHKAKLRRGFFGEDGVEVKWATIEKGSVPTNAILTGQAFAMLGGPEPDAYAKIKGAELRVVAGVLNRSRARRAAPDRR